MSGKAWLGRLVSGLLFRKGGVRNYHVLFGVLMLEDFTFIKMMFSAIVVGMLGLFALYGMGGVKLHLKPTRYAATSVEGCWLVLDLLSSATAQGRGLRLWVRGTSTHRRGPGTHG